MRAVVQRVSRASVTVAGEVVGSIEGPGLCALVGVTHSDTTAVADKLAEKLWGLRILTDEKSCSDLGAPLLIVSQFTLYGDARKGRRPSGSRRRRRPWPKGWSTRSSPGCARGERPSRRGCSAPTWPSNS